MVSAHSDRPSLKRYTARFVADCVKDGLVVSRVAIADAKLAYHVAGCSRDWRTPDESGLQLSAVL